MRRLNRRRFLEAAGGFRTVAVADRLFAGQAPARTAAPEIVVVGAGAFSIMSESAWDVARLVSAKGDPARPSARVIREIRPSMVVKIVFLVGMPKPSKISTRQIA